MGFDIEGARAEGASEKKIAEFLANKTGYDLAGALKAGLSYADVNDYLTLKLSKQASTTTEPSGKPDLGPNAPQAIEPKQEPVFQSARTQHTQVSLAPKQDGLGMASISLLIATALVGFGIAFFLQRKLTKILHTKTQRNWLLVATIAFGFGLMGVLNEVLVHPIVGVTTDYLKVVTYSFSFLIVLPAFIGVVVWRLQVKHKAKLVHLWPRKFSSKDETQSVQTNATNHHVEPGEDLYAQALQELEGGTRNDGVWAKCFAEALGVEQVAKAHYLTIRATQLHQSSTLAKKTES